MKLKEDCLAPRGFSFIYRIPEYPCDYPAGPQ